ncbi:MAG: pyruvate dehydrogenase E2 component (dihydrolipoamide acetyltransferase) [Pseudoalteromonas tetraodonis]|jgi:pyruvate dehydrogenase E2 component (dihydrolipoamide acetyltransferase)
MNNETDSDKRSTSQQRGNGEIEQIELKGMRKSIAQRLQASKQTAPHFRTVVDVDMEALELLRSQMNGSDSKIKLSVNDFLIGAVGQALTACPEINIQFDGDIIKRFKSADVSVAVSIEGGLITPVVKDAGRISLSEISSRMKDLSARAKTGKLKPSEFLGGTFTISNLGMFGIKNFDAIVNPPQAAILAVGTIQTKPVVKNDQLAIGRIMTVTLSSDHRVIDGALAAIFLKQLKQLLETPASIVAA